MSTATVDSAATIDPNARQEGETKTAWRKRMRELRKAMLETLPEYQIAAAKALEKDRRERRQAALNLIFCSDWWAEEMRLGRGPYYPNAPCHCRQCRGLRKWPSPVVSARQLSFECHVLTFARQDVEARKIADSEAHALGLRIIRRRGRHVDTPKGITVMLGQCERCEGIRPYGERFCMACAAVVVKEMAEDGYFK